MAEPGDVLVLFGASGDLSRRKLFPALYQLERDGRLSVPVVGVGRTDYSDEEFRQHGRRASINIQPEADGLVRGYRWEWLSVPPGDTAKYNENPTLERGPRRVEGRRLATASTASAPISAT